MEKNDQYWDLVITPQDKLFRLDLKEIWRYRDLFKQFIIRDFKSAYKQTVLGPMWFLITPVLSVIVYVAVFGGIANISTDGAPALLFYLLGISVWSFFSSSLSATSNTFRNNANLFGKVYFPRMIKPLSAIVTRFLYFCIQMILFVGAYIYYFVEGSVHMNVYALLFPALLILLGIMALGTGMILSSMTTKYRDVQMFFGQIISLWVYITPVIYPLSAVSSPKMHFIMSLNPVTPVMEAIKYGMLGAGSFSWLWLGYSVLVTIIVFVLGLVLFNKVQKSFMDTV